jgi:hypothetical protein
VRDVIVRARSHRRRSVVDLDRADARVDRSLHG